MHVLEKTSWLLKVRKSLFLKKKIKLIPFKPLSDKKNVASFDKKLKTVNVTCGPKHFQDHRNCNYGEYTSG